jgi:hypothetical protein
MGVPQGPQINSQADTSCSLVEVLATSANGVQTTNPEHSAKDDDDDGDELSLEDFTSQIMNRVHEVMRSTNDALVPILVDRIRDEFRTKIQSQIQVGIPAQLKSQTDSDSQLALNNQLQQLQRPLETKIGDQIHDHIRAVVQEEICATKQQQQQQQQQLQCDILATLQGLISKAATQVKEEVLLDLRDEHRERSITLPLDAEPVRETNQLREEVLRLKVQMDALCSLLAAGRQ